MNTLRKLMAVGAIIIVGGVVYWNFPADDSMCLEYNSAGECIDERDKEQICSDMVGEFIAKTDNMCSETPDHKIKRLSPIEHMVWETIKVQGCPAPNGEYDVSPLLAGPEYVYCDEADKEKRKGELKIKLEEGSMTWIEKREAIGIMQIESAPINFAGQLSPDAELLNILSK